MTSSVFLGLGLGAFCQFTDQEKAFNMAQCAQYTKTQHVPISSVIAKLLKTFIVSMGAAVKSSVV